MLRWQVFWITVIYIIIFTTFTTIITQIVNKQTWRLALASFDKIDVISLWFRMIRIAFCGKAHSCASFTG